MMPLSRASQGALKVEAKRQSLVIVFIVGWVLVALSGCTYLGFDATPEWDDVEGPQLGMNTQTFGDLLELPSPAGRIPAAVYGFRDMTGQYREQPHSNLSTAVTQGGGAILTEALLESGWFQPIEREGLQDLLTERRVARQLRDNVAALQEARVLFEGGIVGYDRALTTGGVAARYFGLGASEEYQIDQVTVNLRAVNVENGMVLVSVTTTKTIYSYKVSGGLFRFVRHQRLLDAEGGYTLNEPRLLATSDAISAAVIHLIVRGLVDNHWRLANSEDLDHPIIEAYLVQHRQRLGQGG